MWAADVCSSLRGKAEPIGFDDVVYVLRYRYPTGNLQLVIMPAQQEIVAEVKVLFSVVAGDCAREAGAQASPTLCAVLPRRNLGHLEARHCHQEWSRKVRPSRITIEVTTMKQVPGRIHRVARKRRSRVRAFLYHSTGRGFDHDTLRRKYHLPIGLPKRTDECAFLMDRDRSFERLRIDIEALHGQQAASGHDRCAHLVEFAPAIKAAVRVQNQIKKFAHGNLLNFDRQPITSDYILNSRQHGRGLTCGFDSMTSPLIRRPSGRTNTSAIAAFKL